MNDNIGNKSENKAREETVSEETVSSGVYYAVILAGGEGHRAGGGLPKQFRLLEGIPMLWWSVKTFHSQNPDTRIFLVLHPGFFDDFDIFYDSLPELDRIEVTLICGGRNRVESVANALLEIPYGENSMIAVHDAARPLVSEALIERGWNCCREHSAAVPVVALTDSIRRLTPDGSEAVNRSDYVAVQTPQIFAADLLKDAFAAMKGDYFTDDASIVEAYGGKIELFEGDTFNIKVTNPLDLDIAALLIRTQRLR